MGRTPRGRLEPGHKAIHSLLGRTLVVRQVGRFEAKAEMLWRAECGGFKARSHIVMSPVKRGF